MKHTKKLLFAASVGLMTMFVVAANIVTPQVTEGEGTSTVCPTTFTFLQPTQGAVLNGLHEIKLATEQEVKLVRFKLDELTIGRGRSEGSPGNVWNMMWDTRYTNSGNAKSLSAIVQFNGGGSCRVNPVSINLTNSTLAQLNAQMQPNSWEGPTNTVASYQLDFPLNSSGSTIDIRQYADVQWAVEGPGSIVPEAYSTARYNSGGIGGEGKVKAKVFYGGRVVDLASSTKVITASTAPDDTSSGTNNQDTTTNTTTEQTDDSDSATSTSTDSQNTASTSSTDQVTKQELLRKSLQSNEEIKSCIEQKLGVDNFARIIQEGNRPSPEQFRLFFACYSSQKYVVPSTVVPVDPQIISDVKESENVKITRIRNGVTRSEDDGLDRQTLVLGGVAKPDSLVLLYVYSEPLVLATKTNSDGEWSYSLEDPLEPGEHEVYALVDEGDGEYQRSSIASFFIATAEASEANPNGYSLNLASEPTIEPSNRSINLYIASTIGIIMVTALGVGMFALRKYSTHRLIQENIARSNAISTDESKQNDRKNIIDSL